VGNFITTNDTLLDKLQESGESFYSSLFAFGATKLFHKKEIVKHE
jgi:hypothetical protein